MIKLKNLKKINWCNTLFITLVSLAALVGTPLLASFGLIHWPTWILAGVLAIISGLSITAGYHRLCAHKSYEASWIVKLFFTLFGAAAFQGSVFEWSTDHRNHHRYTDTDKDPYNIKRGFWYAHIGWLFTLDTKARQFDNISDLMKDPLYRFQHRFFPLIGLLVGFGLPTAIAALWGDWLGGLIIGGALRIAAVHQCTFAINSICHLFGKQTFQTRKSETAKDNWITSLVTFGEGFHNFHHQFPIDYRNGVRLYHFDPTKWLIYGLSMVKLTKQLVRVDEQRITKYRLEHLETSDISLGEV